MPLTPETLPFLPSRVPKFSVSPLSMDTLQSTYGDEEDHEHPIDNGNDSSATANCNGFVSVNSNPSIAEVSVSTTVINTTTTTMTLNSTFVPDNTKTAATKVLTAELVRNSTAESMAVDTAGVETLNDFREEQLNSEDISTESNSDEEQLQNPSPGNNTRSPDPARLSDEDEQPPKKQKQLSSITPQTPATAQQSEADTSGAEPSSQSQPKPLTNGKKSSKKKSKNNNVWTKPTSRKGKKKNKNNNNHNNTPKTEDTVLITPIPRFPDKNDDSPDLKICLSKVYKAEKVELSEDRLSASSCKGYRMVRATRGITEGAWYFEIKLVSLGETGHTRLGWSTEKGDLQAPVGYDANSFGYRDIDGSKIHKALREKYGDEGYKEGDVIGCYINLPQGNLFAPKPPQMVWYKGQKYVCAPDAKEDPPKVIPGSEISFFKNGIFQGVAFKDLVGGLYFPAASMYTLPNQPNCVVRFNFGPDFECAPEFESRSVPRPMTEVPYSGFDNQVENGVLNEKKQ